LLWRLGWLAGASPRLVLPKPKSKKNGVSEAGNTINPGRSPDLQ
jgi:hypothetical protein